ncbi:hypothetical protein LTR62_006975 [Meristemomyces frigidus]|uniref:Signal peptidase complex subunit 1 n=1 Tax=Meristemomyces frigidus TaxID=1508187 RepID=A0AAN7YMM4_9PEZI|nr:hypothetical protein LTR62_006975 [Meristemomyces frigidus]
MDALLDEARTIWEGEIDFKGQRLVEFLTYTLLTISGLLAFLVGFSTQDIYRTLYIGLAGTALTFLICVPPWPFYNWNPLPWLPAKTMKGGGAQLQGISIEVDGRKIS